MLTVNDGIKKVAKGGEKVYNNIIVERSASAADTNFARDAGPDLKEKGSNACTFTVAFVGQGIGLAGTKFVAKYPTNQKSNSNKW